MAKEYVFENAEQLAKHLKFLNNDISPLRLQKSLYFLFAFYGASLGKLFVADEDKSVEGFFEGSDEESFPKYLFPDKFEAWQFGPVIRSIYRIEKSKKIEPEKWEPETDQDKTINQLMNMVLDEVNSLGDFELVDRSHEDQAWKEAITEKGVEPKDMDMEMIVNGYTTSI